MNVLFTTIRDISSEKWGGANRVFELIKGLSNIDDINVVLFLPKPCGLNSTIEENYFSHRNLKLLRSLHYVSIIDEANPFRLGTYLKVIKKYDIDIIQNEFLWGSVMSSYVSKLTGIPLIVDEHNFETLFASETGRSQIAKLMTKILEKSALESADHILTLSTVDKNLASSVYNIPASKFSVIPFGINTSKFKPISDKKKLELKRSMGLENRYILTFHGRPDHPPNIEALRYIEDFILPNVVPHIPNVLFLIMGMQPNGVIHDPDHLKFTGYVPSLREYFSISDIAIVPIMSGSGVRVKIIEYASCGIPIVGTFKAVEGLDMENGVHALLSETPDQKFVKNILLIHNNSELAKSLSYNARNLTIERYDALKVAFKLKETYKKTISDS